MANKIKFVVCEMLLCTALLLGCSKAEELTLNELQKETILETLEEPTEEVETETLAETTTKTCVIELVGDTVYYSNWYDEPIDFQTVLEQLNAEWDASGYDYVGVNDYLDAEHDVYFFELYYTPREIEIYYDSSTGTYNYYSNGAWFYSEASEYDTDANYQKLLARWTELGYGDESDLTYALQILSKEGGSGISWEYYGYAANVVINRVSNDSYYGGSDPTYHDLDSYGIHDCDIEIFNQVLEEGSTIRDETVYYNNGYGDPDTAVIYDEATGLGIWTSEGYY